MKRQHLLVGVLSLALCTLAVFVGLTYARGTDHQGVNGPAGPLGSAFTYQGQLRREGEPVSNDCAMAFRLYDQGTGGSQVGPTITTTVPISAGLFTANLDFGSGVFNGQARWLGITVKCPGDGDYAHLGRQGLTAAPYALYALAAPWNGLTGVPDLQQRVSGVCSVGYAIRQVNADGSVVCEQDGDTTYSAGFGLDLIGTQFSVMTNTVQARVSGACAVGSTIRAVNADGTVICQTNAPLYRSTFRTFITLDSAGDVGNYPSITIGADGLGLIAYVEDSLGNLKVAHCSDLACASATITALDTTGVGFYPSITIGTDGLGLISYYDSTDLSVAHCDNLACTSATFSTLDSAGQVGERSSITIGADGLGLISYYDETNDTLKVAHCSTITCTSATVTTLDAVGSDAFYGETSITVGADGLGLISYYDMAAGDLMVAHCSNVTCTSAAITTLDSDGSVPSIAIGADGLGLISYRAGTPADLKVAHCSNVTCTTATVTTLDSEGDTGWFPSLTIGADGLGLISYQGPSGAYWVVAHCSDVACTSATRTTLSDSASGDIAITIGVDGMPLVAHYDANNDDLQIVHCSNAFCTPYFRRR